MKKQDYFKLCASLLSVLLVFLMVIIVQDIQIGELQKNINDLQEDISIYWNPIDTKGLFNKTINDMVVYSDINNFTRINYLMDRFNVTNLTYPYLDIVYYQGLIEKYYGENYSYKNPPYFEHISEVACDGYYEEEPDHIALYKCEGDIGKRKGLIVNEEFIFLHELGHYFYNTNSIYQEDLADEYAVNNIKGVKYGN